MRYTLSFRQSQYDSLVDHLLGSSGEQAAYLLCGLSQTQRETRLLVREVILVNPGELAAQSARGLRIPARSFLPAIKRADQTQACFVFAHSHPDDCPTHSPQDDREEPPLFRTAYNRIHAPGFVHASLVVSKAHGPVGRVWLEGGQVAPVDLIRVYGGRYAFHFGHRPDCQADAVFFDRQVRAFGRELQPLLSALTVGVVGAGGTGSAVFEQLVRLGVGRLIVADDQSLEKSNVSRVYGSTACDEGVSKAALLARLSQTIGLGTTVELVEKRVTFRSALRRFRDCDVIFACTDDEWGRALLCSLSLEYLIPVFDLGVRLDSHQGTLRSIQGRVTLIEAGRPCLYCRRRISAARVAAEERQELEPAEAEQLRREGYAPELPGRDPSVITFTTAVAASAVGEFLHKLTGFKGTEHNVSEILHRFDQTEIKTPGGQAGPDCFCGRSETFARGDRARFLGLTWRTE